MERAKFFRGYSKKSRVYHAGDGFYYYRNKLMAGGRLSLACIDAKKTGCPGRASCRPPDNTEFRVTTRHNHRRDQDFRNVRRLRHSILARCRSGDTGTFQEIAEDEGRHYSRRVQAENDAITLRSSMRRAKLHKYPNIPTSLNELANTIRRNRKLTRGKSGNVYYGCVGSTRRETRCIIFMSKRGRRVLAKAKHLFADGSWDARPAKPKSSQVFSICTATREKRIVPVTTVLMQRRSQRAYIKLLRTLKNAGCNPTCVHTDFETAQYNAWKHVFPRCRVEGCLFHYTQSIKRKTKKQRLTNLLKTNRHADSIARATTAIPLLRRRDFDRGLHTLIRAARRRGVWQEMKPFLKYVKDTWIRQRGHVLCLRGAADRTNNVSESWNRSLQVMVKHQRPNVWLFLKALVKLEERATQDRFRFRMGKRTNRLRKVSAVVNDAVIRRLTIRLDHQEISIATFLKSASHRIENLWNLD